MNEGRGERRKRAPIDPKKRANAYESLIEQHWRAMVAALLDEDYSRYCAERLRWRAAEAMLFELVRAEWAGPEPPFTRDFDLLLEESEALSRRRTWRVLPGSSLQDSAPAG